MSSGKQQHPLKSGEMNRYFIVISEISGSLTRSVSCPDII